MSDPSGTVCPFCAVGCRLDREGDRVVGRAGPANPDGRLCKHGLAAFDSLADEQRLTRPHVRRDGDLMVVDWETALARVVDGFERILADRGADALAFLGAPRCPTETNYLLQKLARTLGTNNVDNRARLCHAGVTRTLESRLGRPATTVRLEDLSRTDLFVVVGANPAERQPVAFNAAVRPAVADGATLVHVDPHANETTRLADHHLAPRPGTDARLVSLVCALVVAGGDVDRDSVAGDGIERGFVENRTTGFDRLRASLGGRDVERDAAVAGVDPETVRDVATAVAAADRMVVMTGTGGDDPATADALVNLCLATGNVGRPGAGVVVLRGLTNEQGAVDAGCVPDRLPGHRPVTEESARDRLAAEWGHPVPATPGRPEHELVASFGDGIDGALVVGENPAVSKRDADDLRRGLEALDTLVVQELTASETTAHADVVLPAAAGVERAGTVTNLDRQVQRLSPRATPPGAARTDFEILRALGRRLVGDGFDHGPRETFAELSRVAPLYDALSYDRLADRSRRWPAAASADGDADGVLYSESFATPDGRARFVPLAFDEASPPGRRGNRLRLVVGDRAGEFGTADSRVDRSLTVHPADARDRGVEDGDPVAVSTDEATVETTVSVGDAVRPGTAFLHASVADPLFRDGDSPAVRLRSLRNASREPD